MKSLRVFLILALVFGSSAFASQKPAKPSRKPAQVRGLRVEVQIGDRRSVFDVKPADIKGKYVMEFYNNAGKRATRPLTPDDYNYLLKKAQKLQGENNKREFCPQKFIRVVSSSGEKTGCDGAQNVLAKDINGLVRLLSYIL